MAVSLTDKEHTPSLTLCFCKVPFNLITYLHLAALISIILLSDFRGEKSVGTEKSSCHDLGSDIPWDVLCVYLR